MPINITAVGGSGTHTLQKVNVNLEENYIYFANRDSNTAYPTRITDDSAWVYRSGSAEITGLTSGTVYYTNTDAYSIAFSSTAGGSNIDITDYTSGSITLNYPNVFDNSFNISSVKYENQQAVRYVTNSTPITGLTSGTVYYVRNQLTGLGGSALYQFTNFEFTTAGVTGRFGPTIEQLRSAYTSADWRNTYLNQGNFQGYQDWTVPEDGVYQFDVKGAPGRQGRALGGGGAIVSGRVRLTKGEIITIICGQRGELPTSGNTWPGSSGASWVIRKSGNIPLFVAGAGSSSGNTNPGLNAVTTNNGGTSSTGQLGGTNGNGAPARAIGGGGGGFLSNGGNGSQYSPTGGGGGVGFPSGLAGGDRSQNSTSAGFGGFGGGGGADAGTGSSGGAGGYSGGSGNTNSGNSVGGGGGSFIFATATNVATSNGLYNGSNSLLGQSITNLNQFNTGDVEGSVSITLVERSVFGFKLYESATDAAADVDPIAIAPAGSQYHALIPLRADLELNKINQLTPHGLLEGEAVQYAFTGTALGGLNNTDVYYVDRVDDYSYKLSLTPDPNFTEINLTTESNATSQALRRVIVNTATNVITINNHGFLVDQPVRYSSGNGNTILPLLNNATYYIKSVLDANRFTLSQSLQGPTVDFTSVGTGTNHSFILTVVNDLEDSLYIPTHGYVSGQTVRYQKSRDFAITNISSSGNTRIINTAEPHGIQVGSRLAIDGFTRPNATAVAPITITRTASSGQTRSLTLASNHSYTTGMYVQISGFTGTNATRFNGIFILTAATGNTLSYTAEESVTITDGAVTGNFTIVRRPDLEMLEHTRVLNVRSIASSGTTRTIVTNEPHYYSTGQFVWIQGISGSVSGIQDDIGEYFNGVFAISATSGTNQFSYVASHEGTPSNLQPSITFTTIPVGTLGVNASGTVYREQIVTVTSSTQVQYTMPSSSLTFGPENVTGRISKIGVRVNNRNMGVSQFGDTANIGVITTDINHDLSVGDKFTLRSLVGGTNANQDVFHGTYRALTGSTGTTLRFTPDIKTVNILDRRLTGNTTNIINTTTPHDFIAGNIVYLENNNSDAAGFNATYWNNEVNIISRESTTTTRTINTDNPHFYSTGDRIQISNMTGVNAVEFNGEYTVASVPSATQFTYTAVNSINAALLTVTGTARKAFSIATVPSFSVSNRSRSGTLADITTSANHDLLVGETVRLDNVTVGGVLQPDFIGEFVITSVPAANRFTFNTATSGTITAAGASGNIVAVNQIRYTGPTYTRALSARQLISNTVASFTTTFDHYLSPGTTITISSITGNQQSVFNGTWVIASTPTARTFTVTRTQQAGVTTFSITTRQRTLNVARITTSANHTLKVGDVISINSITGSDADQFNGTHTVSTIVSATVFEFFTLASGNITSAAVTGNMLIEQLVSETVTGTVTLNTIPRTNATAGNLRLREVAASSLVGELVTDTEITGLENQKIYYIQRVDANTVRLYNDITLQNSTDITSVGIGTHALTTFSVNFDNDTITIPNNGFSLGELVEYDSVGQTVISGLTSGTPYYIIPVNGNTFKLATSSVNAENNVAIDLVASPAPVGRHKLKSLIRTPDGTYVISNVVNANKFEVTAAGSVPEIVKTFNPRTSLDIAQNIIKVVSHGFNTGTEVTYANGGGTDIGGLVDDTHYYVIVVNKDWIRLAETQEDANSGVTLTLTSFGAGLAHTLTSVQINGQITGTGTVTTTAGSVLVNGSGTAFSKILKVGDRFRLFPPDTTTPAYFASTDINVSNENIVVAAHPFTTGDAVSFSPGTGGPIRSIFRISKSGQTVTIVTREPHGYSNGNTATISGLSNASASSEFNGTYTITVSDTFTFTYTHPVSIASAITNEYQTSGIVQTTGAGGVAPNPLVANYYYFVRSIPFTTPATVSNRRRFTLNGFTYLEFTTSANHNLRAGNTFTVSGIGGVNPEVFNGTWTVHQVTSATVVTVNVPVAADIALGTPVIGGTLTPTTSNSLTLHALKSEAEAGTNAVDLTTQGSGSAMVLTKTVPATPIIRKIAAIGSDTQITVDRPYSTTYTGVNFSYPTFLYVRPQGYSLHRPFDGGVEMSTGFGTWFGSIVRQTRKYFRYQSGKGIQTSAGINFKPSIDIENMARVGNSQVVTVRTRRPHGLISGLFCRIDDAETSQGVTSTVYNGTFQVTVIDSFNFTFIATSPIVENTSYGFPRLHVTAWVNGALRAGMFDFQNGMFFEFDGQKLYAVRRSSTQQIAGTCAALQGSEFVFGTNTAFTKQLNAGDYIVLRGQSYKVASIDSDTRLTIKPEFKGNSGNEREFSPGDGSTGVVRTADDSFVILSHGFSQNLPLSYNAIDGSPIGGLINGRTYYVDVVDNNTFRLKASPDATQTISVSSPGTGTPHSFTPAKTGIIATLTVDTRTPQEQWSIDVCDGQGITGYNLDLSKIQMIYMDYSWYGAGKIRYGFKTVDGQVRYVHEYVHNNQKYESYFRSGNLPARYEVTTFANPTYIPSLFHWGTSVMMDGKFDDDRAYLFSKSSPSLNIGGTTAKQFGSTAINITPSATTVNTLNDIITIPSHGFATGDAVSFLGTGSNGRPQTNDQNPQIQTIVGVNTNANLRNETVYYTRAFNANNIILFYTKAAAETVPLTISNRQKTNGTVTITTSTNHGFSNNDSIFINLPSSDTSASGYNGVHTITVTGATTFTYFNGFQGGIFTTGSQAAVAGSIATKNAVNFLTQGNSTATYSLTPAGALNNSSGANYQPLISLRLSPSVSEGLVGALGDRDVINRMQLRLNEIGIQTNQLIDVKVLLNGRLNNLNFQPLDNPSLVQIITHTSNDTISGGVQVYAFRANGVSGAEQTTLVDVSELFELSNSILGGNSAFPDGPDILTVAVARLTGNETLASAKLSWAEAQA